MHKFFKAPVVWALLATLFMAPMATWAATNNDLAQTNAPAGDANATPEPVKINVPATLTALQKRLDTTKQQVSSAKTEKKLNGLNDDTLKILDDTDKLIAALGPMRAQVQAQLDVLGPAPAAGALPETAEVVRQRNKLNTSKTQLDAQNEQATAIRTGAQNLSTQIGGLRRDTLKTQIALNSGSILGKNFWMALFEPQDNDRARFADFGSQISSAWDQAWQPEFRVGSALYLLLALAVGLLGRRLLDKPLNWILQRWLPGGRLRRSLLATIATLVIVFTQWLSVSFFCQFFVRLPDTSEALLEFANSLIGLTVFSALVAGLGSALLSNKHPSWRLPGLADPIAKTLASFPLMLSAFILIFGVVEELNNLVGASVSATLFGNGLSALLVAVSCLIAPMRVNRVRRRLLARGEQPEARSTLAGLIHLAISITAIAITVALLIGYIPLARFLTYELVWVGLVLTCLYLMIHLVVDFSESFFSPTTTSGKLLKSSLSLNERHLSLAATLFAAVGKTLLILFAAVALLNGTFGTTTPIELLSKVVDIWGGKGLEGMNIIPAHAVNAFLCLAIGLYVLRSAKRWLDNDFLPKTAMDRGMRASLVTLFTNVGYVLIILLTLSTLGIEWNRLAWIVSALSVGIGFGLQEIVKNFISGLILLTERPVKVGDLVTISGVEGDIRRINVRATEIQLSDRSTVIVPNSQFISQNVRNATMGNAQGVATIALTFPLDIDPEQVRSLLLECYELHESILETPAPSVSFKELGPNGIVLSVTGYVVSPRMVSGTKSDLLYEILKALRNADISLSQTQTMVLEQPVEKR
ncbi:DUF3772 domain-containing protein [Ewingella allii]|uniref:DUF3772 domain-containing protein n=1 Tax=Ewingella allii TaxID=3092550 RepID=UPI00379FE290